MSRAVGSRDLESSRLYAILEFVTQDVHLNKILVICYFLTLLTTMNMDSTGLQSLDNYTVSDERILQGENDQIVRNLYDSMSYLSV